jgi:stage II sporulation protein D
MLHRAAEAYDLMPTVADQVYGGISAEHDVADRAIIQTRGIVMGYGDSLITAYYHSTCGGATAAVDAVWGRAAHPCLVSMPDTDKNGEAWCKGSKYFSWHYSWNARQLGELVLRYKKGRTERDSFSGQLKSISVISRHSCGRVDKMRIQGGSGEIVCRGDNVRFLLRRPQKDASILPSARLWVNSGSGRTIAVKGSGYGHGVGMCQMGAMARARAGQSYREILGAYYRGVAFLSVMDQP